jgi:energy-coupling factor transporter ATP-binding protein EcfA2
MENIKVKNLGPIKEADIDFGDLTLFVGPQASGKSILLQLLKLVIDRHNITTVLRTNNYEWSKDSHKLLELYFGEAMASIWKPETSIIFNGKPYKPSSFLPKQGVGENSKEEKLFYIPAQRVVTMAQGWPRGFGTFDISDPFVLKQFSETVRVLMERETSGSLTKPGKVFPKPRRIKEPLRKLLDSSIFHGGQIESDNSSLKKRFLMQVGESKLPFMTWSAGQKEFMPLLLSFYHLIPPAKVSQRDSIKWVIIEEPEMGLHPQAIESVMVIFLELVARKYKVIISTHSPVLLELAWAMNYIKRFNGTSEDLFHLFSLTKTPSMQKVFDTVIQQKEFLTYYFKQTSQGVYVKNISSLDAGADDESIANWGGLSEFGSKASDVVSKLVANEEKGK